MRCLLANAPMSRAFVQRGRFLRIRRAIASAASYKRRGSGAYGDATTIRAGTAATIRAGTDVPGRRRKGLACAPAGTRRDACRRNSGVRYARSPARHAHRGLLACGADVLGRRHAGVRAERIDVDAAAPREPREHRERLAAAARRHVDEDPLHAVLVKARMPPVGDQVAEETFADDAR